jgi:hypothetical protein
MKNQKKARVRLLFIFAGLVIGSASLGCSSDNQQNEWVSISYGDLVNKSILTHSGETVAEVIRKIPQYTDDTKGLVQSYLEPYSILCHDVLLAYSQPDTMPLINIIDLYPVGSEQPTWASLFREGHYQLYYNDHIIRVFLKGRNSARSFEKYFSVIRHPLMDVINSSREKIERVEVYSFSNDYASTEIRLNLTPTIYPTNEIDLASTKKSIDLRSIDDFLKMGVTLEAVEVDEANELYFYGRKSEKQSIAGRQLSLADIAVVYRSIFHYGNNAPYISLDTDEDNRYAKVNFGGHLENTLVGDVVLEADKLFKTLSTGIDPNTHKIIKRNITKKVPGFVTEDERSLAEGMGKGSMQIRYWFYPDSIGTVTDGSIGAVLKNQFLADIERMDVKMDAGNSVRETIDHLNRNFSKYEAAEETFKELSTVGRIMALVNWLKAMNIDNRIDLDNLLSVRLPAFATPQKTKKMLAITALAYPEYDRPNFNYIRNNSKVYYISHLLDAQGPRDSDDQHLRVASEYFSSIEMSELAPLSYNDLKTRIDLYEKRIERRENKIESKKKHIAGLESSLNRYNSKEVDRYNLAIDEYNDLLVAQSNLIDHYNSKINQLNGMRMVSRCITSVGGGINLRPAAFKRVVKNSNSPILKTLREAKSALVVKNNVSQYGSWVRSIPSNEYSVYNNSIPDYKWGYSNSTNEMNVYKYQAAGALRQLSVNTSGDKWVLKTSESGVDQYLEYSKTTGVLKARHQPANRPYTARILPEQKLVRFY